MKRTEHTITILVNGKKQELIKTKAETPIETEEHVMNDSIIPQPANNVVDFTKKHLERSERGQPYWDDGNRENSPKLPFNRKKKTFQPSGSSRFPFIIIASILSAIVIGISLGYMMLTIVTGNTSNHLEANSDGGLPQSVPALAEASPGMPDVTVEVVQGGAFSERAKGEEIVKMLHEKNWPAILSEAKDPVLMLIGVAKSREKADQISSYFEEQGQDTYVKTFHIDGQVVKTQDGQTVEWFTRAIKMYHAILLMLESDLENPGEQAQEIGQTLTALRSEKDQLFDGFTAETKMEGESFFDSLAAAYEELIDESQHQENQKNWKVQENLLNALIHYEQLIQKQVNN